MDRTLSVLFALLSVLMAAGSVWAIIREEPGLAFNLALAGACFLVVSMILDPTHRRRRG